ncbi:transcriptional regulator FnrL, partial [Roseivivax sp. CAU 1761]
MTEYHAQGDHLHFEGDAGLSGPFSLRCSDCAIRTRAVCAKCTPPELARLEDTKFYRHYEPGQNIVWEGDRLSFIGSVISGVATLSRTLQNGSQHIVGILMPSDFIGRPGRDQALYDITAASAVTLCCFKRRPFELLMQEMPHISERLLEMTLDELDAARCWMSILGRASAQSRVASFIDTVARREAALADQPPSPGALQRLELPLTRQAIGDHLGLTLETVSRQIGAL